MTNNEHPLWMPPGSVRSILALASLGGYFAGWVDAEIVLLVFGAYFVNRASA